MAKKQVLSFEWNIKNFEDSDLVFNEFIESHLFATTDPTFKSEWKLRLYPIGDNRKLTLKLLRFDSGPRFDIKCSISFLNRNGRRIGPVNFSKSIQTVVLNTKSRNIHQGSTLEPLNYTERFIDNGTLSILCEIEMYSGNCEFLHGETNEMFYMRGTSCFIKNVHYPTNVVISTRNSFDTTFYLPYGSINLGMRIYCKRGQHDSFLHLVDPNYPEVLICRVNVRRDDQYEKENVAVCATRSGRRIPFLLKPGEKRMTFVITARCLIAALPAAYSFEPIATFVREIQGRFRNKLTQHQFGDISINIGDKTVRAHKDILAYYSPVFAAMLAEVTNEDAPVILAIQDLSFDTILAMVEFLYCGGYDEYEKPANPSALLKAAEKYEVEQLNKKCVEWLCNSLKITDVVQALAEVSLGPSNEKSSNFLKPHFGDIALDVDGKTLRAHKDILSCHSPVFATMFNDVWCGEGTQIVEIHDFEFETILTMVEYIYFGDKDDFLDAAKDLSEILKVADMYQLDLLKGKCENWLCKGLNENNVASRLELGNTYNLSKLKNDALCFTASATSKYYN